MRSISQNLARIDLNLLVTLSILLEENNVSRTAEKLFVSQPAVSRALQKLRDIFQDPLFIREANGLRPTVRAQELKQPITLLLSQLNDLIDGVDFNRETCDQSFSISVPSLMGHSLLLPVINLVAQQAPNVVIFQQPSSVEQSKQLASGNLDFAIYVKPITEENFSSTFLGNAYPAIFASKNHPLLRKEPKQNQITLNDCLQYKFVEHNLDSNSDASMPHPALKYIEDNQLQRKVALKGSQLGLLSEVMIANDYLLIGAHYLMAQPKFAKEFERVFLFDDDKYAVATYLNDHSITHQSSAHQWLKQLLIKSVSAVIQNKN
ncbi:LysR family transcriptional regulator [Thalassomonas sp. M1454]|uniref:LysR family transcriptional regulator n=1 Tax=Thalassomonas sp. M1454 TaxID=2594477 RepID=UPI00117FE7C6|nr:LysR family transcriptional regulator [Thalassomonas sp. M1454]TRX54932.1 LysR family transcriptional regulator [Thalassomonas sp. M1454]